MFVGRASELATLRRLLAKQRGSLFVCKGRRRIGKSSLIREFSKDFENYIEFQGLAPREGQANKEQLDNFCRQLAAQSELPVTEVSDWSDAFQLLNSQLSKRSTLVLLDEISWMGKHDKDFSGKLKIAWDNLFSRNNNLVLALCGSVSTWIEENILSNSGFVGRISQTLTLRELTLSDCAQFWTSKTAYTSSFEKMLYLCVTGGVPRYLEELVPEEPFEKNITDICFTEGGFLFDEMEKIFDDSFDKAKGIYRDIVAELEKEHKSTSEIARALNYSAGGILTRYLNHLEQSGFVARDDLWNLSEARGTRFRYRLSDNYLRFYGRLVKSKREQIKKNKQSAVARVNLGEMPNWRSIIGLQFENLVCNNLSNILQELHLSFADVLGVAPYVQRKTAKTPEGCQIDLLIHSKFDTLYLCEMKCRRILGNEVIREMERKLRVLKRPKYLSLRPVLIYAGSLEETQPWEDKFYRLIDMGKQLCIEG